MRGSLLMRGCCTQVIEARNLSFPGNNVGPFGAVDTYAAVFLETEAGVITVRTPSERRHLTAPKWQHDLSFPDAMLSHSVTFAVSCHRRLSSSIIIGQVSRALLAHVLLCGIIVHPRHVHDCLSLSQHA